jgi:hypothetical protein
MCANSDSPASARNASTQPEKAKPVQLFGLQVSYETSLLTLITFFLSISSLAWQAINYFEGPQVKLISPDQITIAPSDQVNFPNRDIEGPYVHFIARLSYVNSAAAGYNATVRYERVRVKVNGRHVFEGQWYNFVGSDAGGKDGQNLIVEKKSYAHPFPLAAGTAESHETLFQPWEKQCPSQSTGCSADDNYVDWTTFISWLSKEHVIEFEFLTDVFGRKTPVSVTCKVTMSDERFNDMVKRRWSSPVCIAQNDGSK